MGHAEKNERRKIHRRGRHLACNPLCVFYLQPRRQLRGSSRDVKLRRSPRGTPISGGKTTRERETGRERARITGNAATRKLLQRREGRTGPRRGVPLVLQPRRGRGHRGGA